MGYSVSRCRFAPGAARWTYLQHIRYFGCVVPWSRASSVTAGLEEMQFYPRESIELDFKAGKLVKTTNNSVTEKIAKTKKQIPTSWRWFMSNSPSMAENKHGLQAASLMTMARNSLNQFFWDHKQFQSRYPDLFRIILPFGWWVSARCKAVQKV